MTYQYTRPQPAPVWSLAQGRRDAERKAGSAGETPCIVCDPKLQVGDLSRWMALLSVERCCSYTSASEAPDRLPVVGEGGTGTYFRDVTKLVPPGPEPRDATQPCLVPTPRPRAIAAPQPALFVAVKVTAVAPASRLRLVLAGRLLTQGRARSGDYCFERPPAKARLSRRPLQQLQQGDAPPGKGRKQTRRRSNGREGMCRRQVRRASDMRRLVLFSLHPPGDVYPSGGV